MKCHYCTTFANVPKSLRKLEGEPGRKMSHRYCTIIREDVTSDTKACEQITPYAYFWCKKWNGWIHIVACIVRRKRRIFPCAYCKQYKEIEYICVGKDMFGIFDVKRRKIKVVKPKNDGKPTLNRRRM